MDSIVMCDHVQFYVEDASVAAARLKSEYGFVELCSNLAGDAFPARIPRSVVLGQGSIVIVLTEPRGPGAVRDYLDAHGEGLVRIGLSCNDLREVYTRAVAGGARVIEPPRRVGDTLVAALCGVGDLVHTLVEQPEASSTILLPGIGQVPRRDLGSPEGLRRIDHFAVCVPAGELDLVAGHYQRAWGMQQVFEERICIGAQAMDSVVVASKGRGVVLTLVTPAGGEPSQIDHFLSNHGGIGVQHVAYSTDDIVATVASMRARGVGFGATPASYYHGLPERVGEMRHELLRLQNLGILVDRDHDGALYQIFTRSTHERGTYFDEIIERAGALTFGGNNVRSLFEAKQRELEEALDRPRTA